MRKALAPAVVLAASLAVPALAQNSTDTTSNPSTPPTAAQNQPSGSNPSSAQIGVNQPAPQVNVQQPAAQIGVNQPAPQVTVKQPEPQVTVTQPAPQVTIEQPKPQVTVNQPKPEVTVNQAEPKVTVEQSGKPNVDIKQPGQPNVVVKQPDADKTMKSADTAAGAAATSPGAVTKADTSPGMDVGTAPRSTSTNPLYAMRGDQIVGKNVYGANGEEIGEVENVVLSQAGSGSPGVVVGVGGFLGIGERHVVIPLDQIQMAPDKNGLTTSLTKDSVKSLQAYDESGWRRLDKAHTLNDDMGAR